MRSADTSRGNSTLKSLDRIVGTPAIRALGLLGHRTRPETLQRIGVLRTAAIGDALLLTGVLRDLVSTFPESQVTLVTGADNAEAGVLAAAGAAAHMTIDVRRPLAAIAALRRCRFDLLIDTGSWPRLDALLTALSGARFRVGFRTSGQHRHHAYDLAVDHSAQRHELENYRALVAAIGVRSTTEPLLATSALPPARDVPAKPFLVLHAWAGGTKASLREWPLDRWVALAKRTQKHVATFVVTGTPADGPAAEALAAAIAALGLPVVALIGGALADVAALLRESTAVVSVNTGIMHLSAQLGVATVGLHGPTASGRWGPVGPRVQSVVSNLPGCGYLHLGFEYDGRRADCMLGVSVDAVERALCELTGWVPTEASGA